MAKQWARHICGYPRRQHMVNDSVSGAEQRVSLTLLHVWRLEHLFCADRFVCVCGCVYVLVFLEVETHFFSRLNGVKMAQMGDSLWLACSCVWVTTTRRIESVACWWWSSARKDHKGLSSVRKPRSSPHVASIKVWCRRWFLWRCDSGESRGCKTSLCDVLLQFKSSHLVSLLSEWICWFITFYSCFESQRVCATTRGTFVEGRYTILLIVISKMILIS